MKPTLSDFLVGLTFCVAVGVLFWFGFDDAAMIISLMGLLTGIIRG